MLLWFLDVWRTQCVSVNEKIPPESFKEERPWGSFADGASASAVAVSRAPSDSTGELEPILCFVTVSIGTAALQWNKAQLDVNTETITLSP